MSLIPQEKLATDFWQHQCEAKEGAAVYNEKGKPCPYCSATEPKPTK